MNVLRVPIVVLAATAAVAVAVAVASPIAAGARPASHAVVGAIRDDMATLLLRARQRDLQIHPRITRAALARVKSRPLFFQMTYVSGAIGVASSATQPAARQSLCNLAKSDPVRFEAAARKVIFISPGDYAYVQSQGMSVSSVTRTYRMGAVFGCGLRPE